MLNPHQRAAIQHLVAYSQSPPEGRISHEQFCETIGITTRTLQLWRAITLTCNECGTTRTTQFNETQCKKCESGNVSTTPRFPEFYAAWKKSESEAVDAGDDLFAIKTRQWALEQLVSMYHKSKGSEKRQNLKMILDMTKDIADDGTPVDFSELSDDELVEAAMNRGVPVETEILRSVRGN